MDDATRLEALETAARDCADYRAAGKALGEIRRTELYRLRCESFAEYVETRLGMTPRNAQRRIVTAELALAMGPEAPTKEAHMMELAKIDDETERRRVWREVQGQGNDVTARKIRKKVDPGASGGHEFYTPQSLTDAARAVMGAIDLDPASCRDANANVRAQAFFDSDGLARAWSGRVWLCPPGGRVAPEWFDKLVASWRCRSVLEGVALLPASTGERWFQKLLGFPVCLVSGKVRFTGPHARAARETRRAIVYVGPDAQAKAFKRHFFEFGRIVTGM